MTKDEIQYDHQRKNPISKETKTSPNATSTFKPQELQGIKKNIENGVGL